MSCRYERNFMTSERCSLHEKTSANASKINVMSTYASQSMGLRGLQIFWGQLDIPTAITNKPISQNIAEILVANAEDTMKEAADKAISYALRDNPDESNEITSSGDIIGRIACFLFNFESNFFQTI